MFYLDSLLQVFAVWRWPPLVFRLRHSGLRKVWHTPALPSQNGLAILEALEYHVSILRQSLTAGGSAD
jgi:hypothetical protein